MIAIILASMSLALACLSLGLSIATSLSHGTTWAVIIVRLAVIFAGYGVIAAVIFGAFSLVARFRR